MSRTKKKIGDRIRITGGRNKDRIGIITGKERRGWTVELEDGLQVNVSFPLAALVEAAADPAPETTPTQEQPQPQIPEATDSSEAKPTESDEAVPTEETTAQPDQPDDAGDRNTSADADRNEPESHPSPAGVNEPEDHTSDAGGNETEDITKLTVKQLQALAKQRGIGDRKSVV